MSARLDPAALQPDPSTPVPGGLLRRALSRPAIDRMAGKLAAWLALAGSLLAAAALAIAFSNALEQGAGPIVFVHLPASWAALCVYLIMAACATLALAWSGWFPSIAMRALAPTGAVLTLLALWAGTWSDGVAWCTRPSDARLTSDAVLLVMYAGFLLLRAAIPDAGRADRAGAALVLVGMFNLPIIYFSVHWWDTLHQGAAVDAGGSSALAASMLAGVLLMALAFCTYAIAAALGRARCLMLQDAAGLSSREPS